MKWLVLSLVVGLLVPAGALAADRNDNNAIIMQGPESNESLTCPPIVIPGVLGTAPVTGTAPLRIYRDGIPSECGMQKTCGTFGAGPYTYDVWVVTNDSGNMVCVTADLENPACSGFIHLQVHLEAFNPNAFCDFFLADIGSSAAVGSPGSMGFDVPAGATMVFVVMEPYVATSIGCDYILTINGEICGGSTPVDDGTWGGIKALYN